MRFRFPLRAGFFLLPLAAVFCWLGVWQWQRMHEKQALIASFEEAPQRPYEDAAGRATGYDRVTVSGHYVTAWHLLHDNRIENGRVGVHVLSVFEPESGPPILVNRGWLPLAADRRSLPEVPTPAGRITLSGLLAPLPGGGVRLGDPDPLDDLDGPKLITYIDRGRLASRLDRRLAPRILLLDAADPTGFGARAWQPAVMLPGQHRAYAVQWFALALAAVIICFTLGVRAGSTSAGPASGHARHR